MICNSPGRDPMDVEAHGFGTPRSFSFLSSPLSFRYHLFFSLSNREITYFDGDGLAHIGHPLGRNASQRRQNHHSSPLRLPRRDLVQRRQHISRDESGQLAITPIQVVRIPVVNNAWPRPNCDCGCGCSSSSIGLPHSHRNMSCTRLNRRR